MLPMKLVRGHVPRMYEAGKLVDPAPDCTFRPVRDQEELILLLREELAEEVGEVLSAPDRAALVAELGDLMDVASTLAAVSGIAPYELGDARIAKGRRLGGFVDGWVLE
jgi:predicted house-cleaning noncanonical NTP pyrophosphatase (MazG superfamily)